ncbi:MAG: hypothetical protein WBC91_19605 [Phototrophicaceae bacterium]
MRLTFTFSANQDIADKAIPKIKTSIQLSDDIKHLIGVEERIKEIGKHVGYLTTACLHISCNELGITNLHIPNDYIERDTPRFIYMDINHRAALAINFSGYSNMPMYKIPRNPNVALVIPFPHDAINLNFPNSIIQTYVARGQKRKKIKLANHVKSIQDNWVKTDKQQAYMDAVRAIRDQLDVLLNADPYISWHTNGFHPFWHDDKVVKSLKAEAKRLEKLNQAAKTSKNAKKHGKGNRIGAIPGKFMGVQFRSQLEIRLATELEKRRMSWIYEEERLGEGNYLVDFHLPDHQAWVEVKGRFEARDHFLLKEVAEVLQELNEKLYVYTSGKPMIVTPNEFIAIPRKEFWILLENKS